MRKELGVLLLILAVGVGDTWLSIIASAVCLTVSIVLLGTENA